MQRRSFLASLFTAAAAPHLRAQSDTSWGGPVLDTHLHLRPNADSCYTHMQGCGVTHAVLLTSAPDEDKAKAEMERRPGHFVRSVRTDPSLPDSDKVLRDALKAGAVSIGEMKYHVRSIRPRCGAFTISPPRRMPR
jgi:hypothetical protein